jgi:DNA-binding MarR family transcriptional regulator
MFNGHLFGEPAWDMLLALYCLPARGEILAVTSLSYAADTAESTGHRWQATLMNEGLIEKGPDILHGTRQLVRLSPKGRTLLENYLTRLFYVSTPAPPHPDLAGG